MSISASDNSADMPATDLAAKLLKGKENPFEVLVRSQRADDDFADIHLPEIHEQERSQLLEMIDWYRLSEYSCSENLQPTRIVTVRGPRGSGKTHMLHSLLARVDQKPQVIVRPSSFVTSLEFEESLLAHLKSALGQEDEFHADRPLDVIAWALTRRLLRQAIRAAGPTDQLFALRPRRLNRFRLLWSGGERLLKRLQDLVPKLTDPTLSQELPAVVAAHGLSSEMAYRLIEGHLRAQESGHDLQIVLRRLLYGAMARSVLLQDGEALTRFLSEEWQEADPSGSSKGSRLDLVVPLLHVLIEACALVRMPVVFAYDNLERLLSQGGQISSDLGRDLATSLAHAVDNTQGILFLVFAEDGLFTHCLHPWVVGQAFQKARWEEGVPLNQRGPVHLVELKEPSANNIERIVGSRVRRWLPGFSQLDQLPKGYPFSQEFLADLVGSESANLRTMLSRLRDEYNHIIYGKVRDDDDDGSVAPPPPDWPQLFDSAWTRSLSAARRQWQNSISQLDIHSCLGDVLKDALPLTVEDWVLHRVESCVSVGEHPDYGVVTLLDWRVSEGIPSMKGPQSLCVAIGFLLAGGSGMAPDLRAKFDFLHERKRGVRLVILWPTQRDGDDIVSLLPSATRQAWSDESENHWRAQVRRIDDLDVRRLIACSTILADVEELTQEQPPTGIVREFLHQRLAKVFPLLLPPAPKSPERAPTDGD